MFISFLVLQIALPLRHHFYPGDVNWTEEGHNFSWHMKLRDKENYAIQFFVHIPETGESGEFDPTRELSDRQLTKMSKRPDMIIQYAHHISDLFKQQGVDEIEVRVVSIVSLNDREPQHMVDPQVNLVEQEITILPKSWILPLED